jgi:hypothetical protein
MITRYPPKIKPTPGHTTSRRSHPTPEWTRAHVSTDDDHIIDLAKTDRKTTRIAHIRNRQSAAALLINGKTTNVLRPAAVAAHRYGDITCATQFLKGLSLINTTLNRTPYPPPRIHGVNPLYVTTEEEATMTIYGPTNNNHTTP